MLKRFCCALDVLFWAMIAAMSLIAILIVAIGVATINEVIEAL